MRTALDSNILSALWSKESSYAQIILQLGLARQEGALLVSGVVYAELLAYPGASELFVEDFLEDTGIIVDSRFDRNVWREAGRRFAHYAERRRHGGEEGARRLLADFLVGAHALLQADRLMTRDARRYRHDFPELRLYSGSVPAN